MEFNTDWDMLVENDAISSIYPNADTSRFAYQSRTRNQIPMAFSFRCLKEEEFDTADHLQSMLLFTKENGVSYENFSLSNMPNSDVRLIKRLKCTSMAPNK
jgi:hypothetical protein